MPNDVKGKTVFCGMLLLLAIPVALNAASVDNSASAHFPPIRSQGNLNACAPFSAIYYVMTYSTARERGWDVSGDENTHKFSPKFIYNLINGGENTGTSVVQVYRAAEDHGAPFWDTWPYETSDTTSAYREWPTSAQVWREAVSYRITKHAYVDDINTDKGFAALKDKLDAGYVLNTGTYIGSWKYWEEGVDDNPETSEDDEYVGQDIAYAVDGSEEGAHGLTIVGYNDDIWIDLNEDGSVDSGETGALKLANSWGSVWRNSGFVWVAYRAVKEENIFDHSYNRAYYIETKSSYTPKMLARFTLNHGKRNQITSRLGIAEHGESSLNSTFEPFGLTSDGGAYDFEGGEDTGGVDGTFVLDFSSLLDNDLDKRYFLQLQDGGTSGSLTIKNFELVNGETGNVVPPDQSFPVSLDGESWESHVDYTADPVISVSVEPGETAEDDTAEVTWTTALNAATGTSVAVDYDTTGEAEPGSDYVDGGGAYDITVAGTMDFAPGEIEKTLKAEVVNDDIPEPQQDVTVELANASNAALGTASAAHTITDADPDPSISISLDKSTGMENNTPTAAWTASLSAVSEKQISVNYAVSGDAVAGSDYEDAGADSTVASDGILDFPPGETTRAIAATVLDDHEYEGDETVEITLSDPVNAALDTQDTAVFTISDADSDSDDLPDDWEYQIVEADSEDSITSVGDVSPHADFDGDGFSTKQEYDKGTDPTRYVLELHEGWNLVSIALAPKDYSVSGILEDNVVGSVWKWQDGGYEKTTDLLPQAGHWVYCDSSVSIDLGSMTFPDSSDTDGDGLCDSVEEDMGTDPDQYITTLKAGWNLISLCRVPQKNSVAAIFGDKIDASVWQWAKEGTYEKAEKMRSLRGYWVYSEEKETIDIGSMLP